MTYLQETSRSAVTVPKLQAMRDAGERIAMLTCYDASFSALCDRAGVDTVLIGDSLGNVLQGHTTTLPVTIDDIAYHTACVARAQPKALIIADLPFGTFGTPEDAFANSVKLMRAGAQMVKIEGGEVHVYPTVTGRDGARFQGLARSIINGMVTGAATGYTKTLQLVGTGYRAEVKGKILNLAHTLSAMNVTNYALQLFRTQGCDDDGLNAISMADYPDHELIGRIAALFPAFTLRRG